MNKQQEKFLLLYKPIHDRFERFCRARVYGNMEYQDLMNETLLVAYKKFDSLKDEKAFLSFLIGISVRILANNHKKNTEDLIVGSNYSNHQDVNSHTDLDAEIYFLYKALAELPDEQRECLVLFEITGFSIKEIMEIQNSSESAIKQRLKRSRAKLLELLTFESKHKNTEVNNG